MKSVGGSGLGSLYAALQAGSIPAAHGTGGAPSTSKTTKLSLPSQKSKFVTTVDLSSLLPQSKEQPAPPPPAPAVDASAAAVSTSAANPYSMYYGAYYYPYPQVAFPMGYGSTGFAYPPAAYPHVAHSMPAAVPMPPPAATIPSSTPAATPKITTPVTISAVTVPKKATTAVPSPASASTSATAASADAKKPKTSASGSQWPPELEKYAIKALNSVATKDKAEMQQWLWKKVNDTVKAGTMWTIDWSREPLPNGKDTAPKTPQTTDNKQLKEHKATVASAYSNPASSGTRSRWDSVETHGRKEGPPSASRFDSVTPTSDKRPRFEHISAQNPANDHGSVAKRPRVSEPFIPFTAQGGSRFSEASSPASPSPSPSGDHPAFQSDESKKAAMRAAKFGQDNNAKSARKQKKGKGGDGGEAASLLQLVFGQKAPLMKGDWDKLTVKGTCTDLEKRYFRLIAPPEPETVRPEYILHKSLEHVLRRHAEGADYKRFVKDQLKSIRQDLTVQRIKNAFTVTVYEAHARIALENKDASEFNQCQTQLFMLYKHGQPGSLMEFTAYRLIYHLYSGAHSDARLQLKELTKEEREHPFVRHALAVRSAVTINDYHRFFLLHKTAPNHGGYVMELLFHRIRIHALQAIVSAYRPSISLAYLTCELRFENSAAAREFIIRAGGMIEEKDDDSSVSEVSIDCRSSTITMVHELDTTEQDQLMHAGLISGDVDMELDQ